MNRAAALRILDRLHAAQNEFYSGGTEGPLRALLHPDIGWTVPGLSPIAGTYHGLDEVFAYFADRRDRAAGTFRMHRRDVLAGEGTRIAALTDGTASIRGASHAWSTVGLYEIPDGTRIAACWLTGRPTPTASSLSGATSERSSWSPKRGGVQDPDGAYAAFPRGTKGPGLSGGRRRDRIWANSQARRCRMVAISRRALSGKALVRAWPSRDAIGPVGS